MSKWKSGLGILSGVLSSMAGFEAGLDWPPALQAITLSICALLGVSLTVSACSAFVRPPRPTFGIGASDHQIHRRWSRLTGAAVATLTIVVLAGFLMHFANVRNAIFFEGEPDSRSLALFGPTGRTTDLAVRLDYSVAVASCAFSVPDDRTRAQGIRWNPAQRTLQVRMFTDPEGVSITCADPLGWTASPTSLPLRSLANKATMACLILIYGGVLWLGSAFFLFRASSP